MPPDPNPPKSTKQSSIFIPLPIFRIVPLSYGAYYTYFGAWGLYTSSGHPRTDLSSTHEPVEQCIQSRLRDGFPHSADALFHLQTASRRPFLQCVMHLRPHRRQRVPRRRCFMCCDQVGSKKRPKSLRSIGRRPILQQQPVPQMVQTRSQAATNVEIRRNTPEHLQAAVADANNGPHQDCLPAGARFPAAQRHG